MSAWRRWWSGEKRGQDDAGPNSADASGRHAGATRRKPRFSLSASLWDGKTLDAVPAPGVSVTRGNAVAPSWQGAHNVGAQPRRGGASRVLAHASARFPALDGHRGPAMIPLIHG